jgi:hypothetical protein
MIKNIDSKKILRWVAKRYAIWGDKHICYVCHKRIGRFLPYRDGLKSIPNAMITLNVIGSDVENFLCPRCESHDRERHLFMYFDTKNVWEKITNRGILHFAPERHLSKRIDLCYPEKYIKADLFPNNESIETHDITNLSFANESFDVVIANHVLEHVKSDMAAMSEIIRVLKPGGLAILQTPYSETLSTSVEDPAIISDKEKLEAYGQEDHVRLYGRDFFDKLKHAGFLSLVCSHEQVLPLLSSKIYGVNPKEPFMCFQKPYGVANGG